MSEVVDIHKRDGKRKHFDVYIGRRVARHMEFTEDSKWANRYTTLALYEHHIRQDLWDDLDELDGKALGCWCLNTTKTVPLRCHGQVLMKLLREKQEEDHAMNTMLRAWLKEQHESGFQWDRQKHYDNPFVGLLAKKEEEQNEKE